MIFKDVTVKNFIMSILEYIIKAISYVCLFLLGFFSTVGIGDRNFVGIFFVLKFVT